MINKKTGEVKFPTWVEGLSRSTTRSQFLESSLARKANVQVVNEPYCSWKIKPTKWDDNKWWTVVVYFKGERLYQVLLAASNNETGDEWKDWTEQSERDMKNYYSSILVRYLGFWQTRFQKLSWGKAKAVYDEKSGDSHILVIYE
jgi:hypothetical protein